MQDREEKREDVIRRKPCGRFRMRWKELAAAALLLLCFWGVFYPELAFPEQVCQRTDGNALQEEDYKRILNAQKGELRITFSFLEEKQGKRTETGKNPEAEEHREDDEIGSTGIQGEARRGI